MFVLNGEFCLNDINMVINWYVMICYWIIDWCLSCCNKCYWIWWELAKVCGEELWEYESEGCVVLLRDIIKKDI